MFNMMLRTYVGPVQDESSVAYLRPETAQGMFINFENVLTTTRRSCRSASRRIGRSFRNEITPGNFIFRTREFEQMEMEYFVKPGAHHDAYDYWRKERMRWYLRSASIRKNCAIFVHPNRGAGALLGRHHGHRVPVPDRLAGGGRHRLPYRLRPQAAWPVQRPSTQLLR